MNIDINDSSTVLIKPRNKKRDANTWTLSYGDLVTALLCFFIIFYALEKQVEKNRANPVKGYGPAEGILEEHKAGKIDSNYEYAIERLGKIPGVLIEKTSAFVDIKFKSTVFFEKGKAHLSQEGKTQIDEVISKLKVIEGHYLLEIQGHADPSPVKSVKSRWWRNNMELSVLRALNVHTYLAENFIAKEQLIVAGYGSQQKIDAEEEENQIDMHRRISLRLHLVK